MNFTQQQKIWIVFLGHIFFLMRQRCQHAIDYGRLKMATPTINFFNGAGEKLFGAWTEGDALIDLKWCEILHIKYDALYNDVFIRNFGDDMQKALVEALFFPSSFAPKTIWEVENNKLVLYAPHGKSFCYDPNRGEEGFSSRTTPDKYDSEFEEFFRQEIGLDFFHAAEFFGKIKTMIPPIGVEKKQE